MRTAKRRLPTETPTAALLHDVGKLVMARFVESEHLAAIDAGQATGATRMEAEAEVLGVDHAQLGGMVARAWCLPDSLIAGIERHHATKGQAHPDSAELIGYAVHVSDVVAKAVGGVADDNAEVETFARAMGELGLSADDYDTVCATVRERFVEVVGQFA
jgi:HD-like signal output (HDOD) protein